MLEFPIYVSPLSYCIPSSSCSRVERERLQFRREKKKYEYIFIKVENILLVQLDTLILCIRTCPDPRFLPCIIHFTMIYFFYHFPTNNQTNLNLVSLFAPTNHLYFTSWLICSIYLPWCVPRSSLHPSTITSTYLHHFTYTVSHSFSPSDTFIIPFLLYLLSNLPYSDAII